MKFARPFLPSPADRAHVIAGLELLASYIEGYPHVFQLQQEARALLSPADLRDVAQALSDREAECVPEAPFFFSEERESIRTGLLALADMSRFFGQHATADHFAHLFADRGIAVGSPESINAYRSRLEESPAIDEMGLRVESPHKPLPPLESPYLVTHTSEDSTHEASPAASPVYDPDVSPLHQLTPSL